MDTIKEETYKSYTIRIVPDADPINPREDSNLATLVLFHNRYTLGDQGHGYSTEDFSGWDAMERKLRSDGAAVCLRVYGYDHSSLSISTKVEPTWWHYRWDGGRLGFAVAFRKDIERIMGWKLLDPERIKKLTEYVQAEVEAYASYVAGGYVGYIIEDEDGEEQDSCYNFADIDEALSEAKGNIDALVKDADEHTTDTLLNHEVMEHPLESLFTDEEEEA